MAAAAAIVAAVAVLAGLAVPGCDFGEEPLGPAPVYTCFRIHDPYARGGLWARGNFHMHSAHSDGALDAGALVQIYEQHGFGVLCVSDHNQYGDQDGGILPQHQADSLLHDWNGDGVVHPEHRYGSGVEAYVRDYTQPPAPWARNDWFRPKEATDGQKAVVIAGAELSTGALHYGTVGLPPGPVAPPVRIRGDIERALNGGGFVFVAHPGEWNDAPERFLRVADLRGVRGIEIFNGLRSTQTHLGRASAERMPIPAEGAKRHEDDCAAAAGPADATPLWDGLLSRGHRLWGLANDDAHTWIGADEAYPFTGFNVLQAHQHSEAGFLEALRDGAFYGSTGLYFREIGVRGDSIVAWAPEGDRVRFIGWGGRVLLEADAPRAAYRATGGKGYVRVEVSATVGAGGPRLRKAWSQPFYIDPEPCPKSAR